jgi:hypothetical protein
MSFGYDLCFRSSLLEAGVIPVEECLSVIPPSNQNDCLLWGEQAN